MSTRPPSTESTRADVPSPGHAVPRRRWLLLLALAPLLALLAIAGSWWRARASSARVRSIAVLPFADLTHTPDQDWFGDGITGEIIDGLAPIPGLRVAAQVSSFQFKNQPRDLHRIGVELGVAAVLQGRIQETAGRLNAAVELVRAEDGYRLWSATINPPAGDAYSLQREIVRALALRIQIGAALRTPPHLPSAQAYNAYLEGRALFGRPGDDSLTRAAELFAGATRFDPDFAMAWAWQSIATEYRVDAGQVHSNEAMPAARDAAERAVALDAGAAAPHLALAIVLLQYDWDWSAARQELDRALQLSPGSAFAQHWLAHWYETQGRLDDAIRQMQSALTLDPLSDEMLRDVVNQFLASANPSAALPFAQKAASLFPQDPRVQSSLIGALFYAGKRDQARQLSARSAPSWQSARWSAILGEPGDAQSLLDQADILRDELHIPAVALASVAAAAGDWDRVFDWLNIAYDERSVHLPYARLDARIPAADPRFIELLDKMNLPPAANSSAAGGQ